MGPSRSPLIFTWTGEPVPITVMELDKDECTMCEHVLPVLLDGSLPRHICT